MVRFGELTAEAREALVTGDADRLGRLIDANFDLRRSICRLPPEQVEMVDRARRAGASAHFAGSGGAILGVCSDEQTFARLKAELEADSLPRDSADDCRLDRRGRSVRPVTCL